MRRLSTFALLLATASCVDVPGGIAGPDTDAVDPTDPPRAAQAPMYRPGVVVVRFIDPAQAQSAAEGVGAAPVRLTGMGSHVLAVTPGREQAVIDELSGDPRVQYAELSLPRTLGVPCAVGTGDCAVPADGLFSLRWDLHNDGAVRDAAGNVLESVGLVPDADMDWLEAYDQLGAFTGSAVVGVIDTGIFGDHEDLAGRLIAEYDAFNDDDVAEDDNGHGTHVSGIVLGRANNGAGAAGVAYGPNVQLIMSKVCGYFFIFGYICWSDDIADGIVFAVDNGANVLNLSLGGVQGTEVEHEALQYALANDVLPVCAAGNSGGAVNFPGAFPECMAVSATDWADQLSSYSSFGPEVEVSAPGGDILHPEAYDRIMSSWNDGGYAYAAGTSMATPQVAGLAALLHALGITSAEEKRQILRSSAEDLGAPGFDPLYGDGRINVWNGVLTALGEPPPPPPPNAPPTASFTSDCVVESCSFTDASVDGDGFLTAWSWDFGDGSQSVETSPSHDYAAGGDYTVSLTVTDNGGLTAMAQQTVTVSDPPPNMAPTAAFTFECAANVCTFTDASGDPDGTVTAWSWDFGDGEASTEANPAHAYAAAGEYTVSLIVTDDGGLTGTVEQAVTAADPPPNVPPTASFTAACAENGCMFADASSDPDGVITTWAWDFGDGETSDEANVGHLYAAGGDYVVTLTVTDDGGDGATTQQTVTVTDPLPPNVAPTSAFSVECTETTCAFTDESFDEDGSIADYWWEFGDGYETNAPSPTHVYPAGGDYVVRLSVMDDRGGTDVSEQTVTVGDLPPPPPNTAPTASFSYSCSGTTCLLTDTSTDPDGSVVAWWWDFGDGSATNAPTPTHVYPDFGDYLVTLTVTDNGGLTAEVQSTVTVTAEPPPTNTPPTAGFSSTCAELSCVFTDTSSDPEGGLAAWWWDFGDGSATNAPSPTHVYASGGTYLVSLTVTDDGGLTDVSEQSITVDDPPPPPPNAPPTADFGYVCSDVTCVFTDASSDPDGSLSDWWWDFGDGSATNAPSPTHVYASSGSYLVSLTVTDDGGLTDVVQQTVLVDDPPPPNAPPVADFTYSCSEQTCVFGDASTDPDGSVTAWWWDFGDGSATNAPNPTHVYPDGGDYLVTLTVTDNGGVTGATQQTVTVDAPPPPPPNAGPHASFNGGCTYVSCTFVDQSSDPDGTIVAWWWDFGDGSATNAPNPTHVFPDGGDYTVTLTVTDNGGLTDSEAIPIRVDPSPPPPPNDPPTADFTFSCSGLLCYFSDTSTDSDGSVVAWWWNFGDGSATNAPNPAHFFPAAGEYAVELTATDDRGASDTVVIVVTVGGTPDGDG